MSEDTRITLRAAEQCPKCGNAIPRCTCAPTTGGDRAVCGTCKGTRRVLVDRGQQRDMFEPCPDCQLSAFSASNSEAVAEAPICNRCKGPLQFSDDDCWCPSCEPAEATREPKLGNLKSLDDCISFLADAVGLASWSLQRDYDQSCLAHLRELKLRDKSAPAAAVRRWRTHSPDGVASAMIDVVPASDYDQCHADREALRAEKAGLIRDVKHYLAKCEALAARVEALSKYVRPGEKP